MSHPSFRSTAVLVVAASLFVAGCATPPPPVKLARTTVVLMPDEDGSVGTVSVTSATGSQKVDRAYASTTVEGGKSQPTGMTMMASESVADAYRTILAAQPPAPKTFIVNFLFDKTVLTEESRAQIPAVMKAIRERKPTEITIFGHADASGSEKHNYKLSADRARAIAALLKKSDPDLDKIDVQYFGEKAPLVSSDPARNRRAEIMIL
jgi:peptidoglycan-associated lipoprotein